MVKVPDYKRSTQPTQQINRGSFSNTGIDGGQTALSFQQNAEDINANLSNKYKEQTLKYLENVGNNALRYHNILEENKVNNQILDFKRENDDLARELKENNKGVNSQKIVEEYNKRYDELLSKYQGEVSYFKKDKFNMRAKMIRNSSNGSLSTYVQKEQEKVSEQNFQTALVDINDDIQKNASSTDTFNNGIQTASQIIRDRGITEGWSKEVQDEMLESTVSSFATTRANYFLVNNDLETAGEFLSEAKSKNWLKPKAFKVLQGQYIQKLNKQKIAKSALDAYQISPNSPSKSQNNILNDNSLNYDQKIQAINKYQTLYEIMKRGKDASIQDQSQVFTQINGLIDSDRIEDSLTVIDQLPEKFNNYKAALSRYVKQKANNDMIRDHGASNESHYYDSAMRDIIRTGSTKKIFEYVDKLSDNSIKKLFQEQEKASKIASRSGMSTSDYMKMKGKLMEEALTREGYYEKVDGLLQISSDSDKNYLERKKELSDNIDSIVNNYKGTFGSYTELKLLYDESLGRPEGEEESKLYSTLKDTNEGVFEKTFYAVNNMMPDDANPNSKNLFAMGFKETLQSYKQVNGTAPTENELVDFSVAVGRRLGKYIDRDELIKRVQRYNIDNPSFEKRGNTFGVSNFGIPLNIKHVNENTLKICNQTFHQELQLWGLNADEGEFSKLMYMASDEGVVKPDSFYELSSNIDETMSANRLDVQYSTEPYSSKIDSFIKRMESEYVPVKSIKDTKNSEGFIRMFNNVTQLTRYNILKKISERNPLKEILPQDNSIEFRNYFKEEDIFDKNSKGVEIKGEKDEGIYSTIRGDIVEIVEEYDGTKSLVIRNGDMFVFYNNINLDDVYRVGHSLKEGDYIGSLITSKLKYDVKTFDSKGNLKSIDLGKIGTSGSNKGRVKRGFDF